MAGIPDHPRNEHILEQVLEESNHQRQAQRDFWARIAAERAARREDGRIVRRADRHALAPPGAHQHRRP